MLYQGSYWEYINMVDKINPLSQVQNLPQVSKAQKPSNEHKSEKTQSVDEVVISKEALNLSQIEDAAKQAAQKLADDETSTLSNDIERLSILI